MKDAKRYTDEWSVATETTSGPFGSSTKKIFIECTDTDFDKMQSYL